MSTNLDAVGALSSGIPANATLTTRMHDALESAIINGDLQPGERLHADALAAQYGMSRIPVREALRSLHEAGWVDIKPRHGVHVRERTVQELGELFEFRAEVEGLVARWAATRRTAEDLERLEKGIAADLAVTAEAAAGSHFYAALRIAAHNTVLAHTSAGLEKRARFYFATVAHALGDHWQHVHEDLIDHVVNRRKAAAEKVAHQHIDDTGKAVRALLFSE